MTHGLDTSFLVAAEVACHADHTVARALASSLRQKGDQFALAPQALAEFMHVVTDAKRFTAPVRNAIRRPFSLTWAGTRSVHGAALIAQQAKA